MIGLYNIQTELKDRLSIRLNIFNFYIDIHNLPKLNGLIINWQTKNNNKSSKHFVYQATLINHYIKKIPIIVIDNNMCMINDEYNWLKKFNVKFFEPALNNRRYFEYLPHWINLDEKEILDSKTDRNIDLGFLGDRKIESFEKYYIEFMRKYPDWNVVYNDQNLNWKNVRFTIAIDNQYNYNTGYLNQHTFDALSNGCMVLLPIEHKFFGNMFRHVTIMGINEINYFLKVFKGDIKLGSILNINDDIQKSWQEHTLDYTVNKICETLK